MKIGYQGINGSNSERAAKIFVEELKLKDVELVPLVTSLGVVKAIENKEVNYGVLALRNSIAGLVVETDRALSYIDYQKVADLSLEVHQCVFIRKDKRLDEIIQVYSHEQAIKQTRNNCRTHFPHWAIYEIEDTAIGAKYLSEGKINENSAVICSKEAGEMYENLKLIYENFEDKEENETKFILIM